MPPKRKSTGGGGGGAKAKAAKTVAKGKGKGKAKRQVESDDESDDDGAGPASQGGASSQTLSRSDKAYKTMNKGDQESKVIEVVRLMLFKGLQKKDVKLKDVQEVLGTVKAAAPAVLHKAREKLKHIFGFDLVQLPEAQKKGQHPLALHEVAAESERKTGAYAVMNVMDAARELPDAYDPPVPYPVNFEAQLPFVGLRMTILLLIYSNTGELGSVELWDILKKFGINDKNMKSHPVFGNVERFVDTALVKQQYLVKEKVLGNDAAEVNYRWGRRAQAEYTEKDLLKFAASVYGEDVDDWLERLGKQRGTAGGDGAGDSEEDD